MIEKPAITEQAIAKIIAQRWSSRAFDSSVPVSAEHITALIEAARWAPSCYGDEPWRFLICNHHANPEAWQKIFDSLSAGNQQWAQNAPLLILAASNPDFSHNGKTNKWNGYDTGAASISLCLQATALGLASHQMGGFDANKLRKKFDIPAEIELWTVIAVGYPASLDSLTPEQLQRELEARERRPIFQQFYDGKWPQKDKK